MQGEMLKSNRARDRRLAVIELFNAHSDIKKELLIPMLEDTDTEVSYLTALALQDVRDLRILKFIKENMEGKQHTAALTSYLLERTLYPEYLDLPRKNATETHYAMHIHNLGNQYMKNLEGKIFPQLQEALEASSPAIREAAYKSLAKITSFNGNTEAQKMLVDAQQKETDVDAARYALDKISQWTTRTGLTYRVPEEQKDMIEGGLIGILIGDALGAAPEFMSREQIKKKWGIVTHFLRDEERDLDPGEYTDDGEMTLFTLDFMVNNVYSPQGLAEFFAEKLKAIDKRQVKWRGYGNTTRVTLRNIGAGTNFRQTYKPKRRGCGAAMRILPIGIANYGMELEEFRDEVVKASNSTHTSSESVSGALALAYTARKILRGEHIDENLFDEINFFTRPYLSADFSSAMIKAKRLLHLPTQDGADLLDDESTRTAVTIPFALYLFHKEKDNPDGFENAVVYGANTDGDSDSIASMAGGLVGLRQGKDAIPAKFADQVNDKYLRNILDNPDK